MKAQKYFSLDDFKNQAKYNLPKFVFDFIDGGAGNEIALTNNINAFQKIKLIPRIKNKLTAPSYSTTILGLHYSYPFGIAPLGLCGLIQPRSEVVLAKLAAKYNIPYIASTSSNVPIDEITNESGVAPWLQIYIPKAETHLDNLIRKAEDNQCPVLVVTVDASTSGRRLRDLRNGLKIPYDLNFSNILACVMNPKWAVKQLLNGKLSFPNYINLHKNDSNEIFSNLMSLQTGGNLDWDTLLKIRNRWKGKLVLKGVLSELDGMLAAKIGIDTVIISNHGGRQINASPAPISILSKFVDSGLGQDFLMLDSGIRSGEDIIISLSQGASYTFIGRPFLYALAAEGTNGATAVIEILAEELSNNLKLLGISSIKDLSKENIYLD